MHIHWFSPMPPDRTDIGHFTNRVLPALLNRAKVTVWTNTSNPKLPPDLPIVVRPIRYTADAIKELNQADAIFYNIGNNGLFHTDIQEAAWRIPGVLVLHEADLQGLFSYYWLEKKRNPPQYVAQMARLHGDEGARIARRRLRGDPVEGDLPNYPILEPALRNALGAVCHTEAVLKAVSSHDLPVFITPLPYEASALFRSSRREGPLRLLQFGYLGPHRRLSSVLRTLARQANPEAFRFDIFGELWDGEYVKSLISSLKLDQVVRLHGFVSDDALDKAVAEADLVFNLRFPTVGEASGTQLRIWNGAAPSVVTRTGWFADLPEEAVIKIDPAQEEQAINMVLSKLGSNRYCYDDIGLAGRKHLLEHHNPQTYADTLLSCVGEVASLRQKAAIRMNAKRLGQKSKHFMGPKSGALAAQATERLLRRWIPN